MTKEQEETYRNPIEIKAGEFIFCVTFDKTKGKFTLGDRAFDTKQEAIDQIKVTVKKIRDDMDEYLGSL